jgi:DHA1 family bicyclomycin/chloramphenicol resistance-like MFS transporter
MFVPALPQAAVELGVPAAAMQQTISVFLLGLGLSQPIWGPVSDSFDRRAVLAASLLLFLAGTLAAAIAPSLALLLAARWVQGAGAAGALITCRAIVSATSAPGSTARNLAHLTAITLVSPALAPLAGSLIAAAAGWRSLFVILSFLAACGLALLLRLPPTPPAFTEGRLAAIATGYRRLLANSEFNLAVAANAFLVASFYIYLAASPFILQHDFGLSSLALGLCYATVASAMIAGTLTIGRFHQPGGRRLESIGLVAIAAGGIWLGGEALAGLAGPSGLILPMALLGFGSGILAPLVLASAIQAEAGFAGSAASIFGTVQTLATAGLSALVTLALGSSTGAIAAVAASALTGAAVLLLGRRLRGQQRLAEHP